MEYTPERGQSSRASSASSKWQTRALSRSTVSMETRAPVREHVIEAPRAGHGTPARGHFHTFRGTAQLPATSGIEETTVKDIRWLRGMLRFALRPKARAVRGSPIPNLPSLVGYASHSRRCGYRRDLQRRTTRGIAVKISCPGSTRWSTRSMSRKTVAAVPWPA